METMQDRIEHREEIEPIAKIHLPEAPASETGPVKAWDEPVMMRTYMPAPPDRNPLFLEKRVYQGSSGRVYPLPVIDRVDTEPRDHWWKALHIENEYIRAMVLPEIGGRIHIGLDKLNHYDFFYRQNVIKPALVGLAGPWISGGVEFNWPQHHRPATFMEVETTIERSADGSVTIWCSDHDPMARMKGMHGVCLRPGRAYLELRVRLYNRTTDTQTFLWWANAAVRVHEHYQSFFPRDVRFVADHARRAVTEFPLSQGTYYGINYGERARDGVPPEEQPSHFVPDGSYPANDLSRFPNIPVPTSYMVVGSHGDFSGGYDHARQAGVVHVANHHIAPGKKQWTWGNHEFGYAWDRNLTDSDGPYVELMAGVYTDNQPDFSFLAPGETKTFCQFWYPIREIGVPDEANTDAAVRLERTPDGFRVHLLVTREWPGSTLRLLIRGEEHGVWAGDLRPEVPLHYTFPSEGEEEPEILLKQGETLILRYEPQRASPSDPPAVATEPPLPAEVGTSEELFLIGQHLEQYRHPTRNPEPYWQEAIRRDPGDSRSHHALGRWRLRRGEFAEAERHFRAAIARLTERNANPYDGEPFYNLGQVLAYLGRFHEAYAAFYKSTWNAAWRGPAHHRLAEIDCSRHNWETALEHITRSLCADVDNLNARNLKAQLLRKLNHNEEAAALLCSTRALDPLDIFSAYLESGKAPSDLGQRLDLALDLARAGWFEDALFVLSSPHSGASGAQTMLLYARAHVLNQLGRDQESLAAYHEAATSDPACVFPSRLEEMLLLEEAMRMNPSDARAPYYLANLLYDRKRHREAITLWEHAARLDPEFPTSWRNLGFGYYNVMHDSAKALSAFEHARRLSPADARILYEEDQLAKRTGAPLEQRLSTLEANRELVWQRDDLSVELATLYNSAGNPDAALQILFSRQFQPWEGGEGLVLAQYVRAQLLLGQRAMAASDAASALRFFQRACDPPRNLSEARHLLSNLSMIDYWLGIAYAETGERQSAIKHWEYAARTHGDFQQMQVQSISEMTFWSAKSILRLKRESEGRALLQNIYDYAVALDQQTPTIDYFATSLPAMLLFEENLKERQTITTLFLRAQALLGMDKPQKGLELLQQVLTLDRSHTGAIDLLNSREG